MKKINTEFGELEFQDDAIIHFDDGIYGFEDAKDYVLINHDDNGTIMTLQYTESSVPQFVVLDPFAIVENYAPLVSAADKHRMEVEKPDELKFLLIAIVKDNYLDTIVNLKSPIVINPVTHKASQIFVENANYSMKHKVFNENGGYRNACN